MKRNMSVSVSMLTTPQYNKEYYIKQNKVLFFLFLNELKVKNVFERMIQ